MPFILKRFLLLTCATEYFSYVWEDNFCRDFIDDSWNIDDVRLYQFTNYSQNWIFEKFHLNDFARRMASIEIDVLTAMGLNLALNDLIDVYEVQFRVLNKNENDTWYDQKGKIVFTANVGLVGVGLDRPDWEKIKAMPAGETYEHTITKSELYQGEKVTYYAPFAKRDRVEDYKRAWAYFRERFN